MSDQFWPEEIKARFRQLHRETAYPFLKNIYEKLCPEAFEVEGEEEKEHIPTERERLLAVASPEKWEEWLQSEAVGGTCLFCTAFNRSSVGQTTACKECTGAFAGCLFENHDINGKPLTPEERQANARARLERLGVLPIKKEEVKEVEIKPGPLKGGYFLGEFPGGFSIFSPDGENIRNNLNLCTYFATSRKEDITQLRKQIAEIEDSIVEEDKGR